tara:strand:+ start:283 stop:2706 length:2424 start_codon:yes stop_codon:yes gene_type:complete
MLKSGVTGSFPSQVVSDLEKMTGEYGLSVGKAISSEWFNNGTYNNRYLNTVNNFHNLRLYARGEQSVQKYKDELSINGDLSYLNLDWKPVPIIPKFVDIVVNGIAERMYDIKAYSQDPHGVSQRTKYMESLLGDYQTKNLNELVEETLGITINENDKSQIPGSEQELDLHMQLTYKQAVELAEEQALNVLLEGNRYELIKKQFYYDLTVLGMGAVKTTFNQSEGVKVDYVDPANLVYSYTDSPYFEDIYYVGEVKEIPINELVKQFPELTHENLEEIIAQGKGNKNIYGINNQAYDYDDNNKVSVLYFNYKTHMNEVYKMKETRSGGDKAIEKDDTFNPPEEKEGGYSALKRCIEVLFEGAMILGSDKLLKWEIAKNMMRPKSDFTKVKMNYAIVAPRMYNGRIESLVGRITGFADMIQLTHLKLQQVMSRMTPDGIYLDADGLAEIDLGNGTNYNPQEALNMYFQTGSIIGRSFTADGDQNPGKMPIQEIQSGSGGNKMQALIGTYNYYLQMIRDVTGLNEAKDGSTPDKYSLVGVQKLAAANSNTATRHILQAGLFLTSEVCESLSLRISDIIEYSPTKNAFVQQIGAHNVATLKEMSELHLYDFGIFVELMPDEEEKQLLENNIQAALAQQTLDIEDAIDLREIKNIKLANQLLKVRRKKKLERDQKIQQENIMAQAQANTQSQQAAAQMEIQKKQSESQSMQQLEQIKARFESERMMQETELKKQLMDHEFEIKIRIAKLEADAMKAKEDGKEDRKDERTKIQATQQSELIDQRKNEKPPKNFETPKEEPNQFPKMGMTGLGM